VWHGHSANQIDRFVSICSHSGGPFGTILTTHSWELDALHRTLVDSGKGFRRPICHVASTLVRSRLSSFIGSEPSHGVALDPVGSISLAYCYVLMTPSPGACNRTGVNVPIDSDSFVHGW
jgi:hypothetical protein